MPALRPSRYIAPRPRTPEDVLAETRSEPGLLDLFLGFSNVSALAFGGVLPWARFVIVDKRRWLTSEEFVDTLALCQLLPGPNIVNMSVAIGARFAGPLGSVASVLGLMLVPVVVVLLLATLYGQFSTLPAVRGALAGMAAAAAGLIMSMAFRMAEPMLRKRFAVTAPFLVLTFAAVALLRLPLWPVILVLAPLSIVVGWRFR